MKKILSFTSWTLNSENFTVSCVDEEFSRENLCAKVPRVNYASHIVLLSLPEKRLSMKA
jgi:hypothetical protein